MPHTEGTCWRTLLMMDVDTHIHTSIILGSCTSLHPQSEYITYRLGIINQKVSMYWYRHTVSEYSRVIGLITGRAWGEGDKHQLHWSIRCVKEKEKMKCSTSKDDHTNVDDQADKTLVGMTAYHSTMTIISTRTSRGREGDHLPRRVLIFTGEKKNNGSTDRVQYQIECIGISRPMVQQSHTQQLTSSREVQVVRYITGRLSLSWGALIEVC